MKPFTDTNGTAKTVRFSDEVLDLAENNGTKESGTTRKRKVNGKKREGSPKWGTSRHRLYLPDRLKQLKE